MAANLLPVRRHLVALAALLAATAALGGSATNARAAERALHPAPPAVISIPLPQRVTQDVAVPFATRLDVGTTICSVDGPPWVQSTRDRYLELDADRFFPAWIRLRLARAGAGRRGCHNPTTARVFVYERAVPRAPDAAAIALPDAGVIEITSADLSGHSVVLLKGAVVVGVTRCLGKRRCTAPVPSALLPRWLEPSRDLRLLLWPAAVPLATGDVPPALFDARGPTRLAALTVDAVRFQLDQPLIAATELDGHADRSVIPLSMPEAVIAVRCKYARCALTAAGLEVYSIDAARLKVRIRLELRPQVVRMIGGRAASTEAFWLKVVRCAIRVPGDAPLLGGVESHSYAVALSRDCLPAQTTDLKVHTFPPTTAWIRGERKSRDRAFRVFEIMFAVVPERISSLELTLRRADHAATTLATVRVPVTRDYQPVGVRLDVGELGSADFVPRNRVADLRLAWVDPRFRRDIQVIDRPGFYTVQDNGTRITGATAATGSVPLRLAYAPAALTRLLRRAEPIAVFDTIARYPVRTLNIPLPLTGRTARVASARHPARTALPAIVRVYCKRGEDDVEVPPGSTFAIAHEDRFGCRLVIDRSAIAPSAGDQRLRIRAPGLNEVITVGARQDTVELAIPVGNREEFALLSVSAAHEYTGAHYDFSPRQSLGAEAAWHIVLGDRSFRASVGTAMPTGLFRFGAAADKGAVAFSAGGLARVNWLYREGREFPIGLDFGVLGTGLSSDPQLSFVTGLGFSVPVLNANTSLQASFNLHAWFEYSPTRTMSRTGFLFGPSFTVGKFSTSL